MNYFKLLAVASSFLIISVETINHLDELYSNCSLIALDVISYKRSNDFVYAVFDPDFEDIITSVVVRFSRTLILSTDLIRTTEVPLHHQISPAVYLLYSSNIVSFQSTFSKLRTTHSIWFPKGVFIVLLQQHLRSDLEIVSSSLYSANAYNFIILTSNEDETAVDAYKWYPFAETSRCGSVLNVQKINVCDGSKMQSSPNDLFSIILSRTFPEGCIINAAAFHWPPYTYTSPPETNNFVDGFNIFTMKALMRKYGVKVSYIMIDHRRRWGMLLKNGTWTGVLGALQSGEADIALGGILQTTLRFRNFDCSYTGPLFMNFYLALPGKLPHWKSMIRIFSFAFWMIIAAVYVITCIFICILSRTAKHSETEFYKGCSNSFLSLWRIALSTPTNTVPSSRTVQLIFLSWLVYSFHITLVYSSALLGVITTPIVEEPTIHTLEEFSATNMHLLVVPQFVQISMMMDEALKSIISKKNRELTITDAEEIDQMILKKNFAIVDPKDHFEIVAQEKLEYIYQLDDIIRLNQGLYLRKGSIFLKYVNDIQYLVSENGLFDKCRRDLVGAYKYKKHRKVEYRNEVLPLMIEELSGSFYVLFCGLWISVICFCFELCYGYLGKKKKKKEKEIKK